MASPTDVRQWLREQGRGDEAGTRGLVKAELVKEYEDAHPARVVPGAVEDDYPDAGGDVTAGSVPAGDVAAPVRAAKAAAGKSSERPPKQVKPPRAKSIKERIFGGPPGKSKPKTGGRARVSLGDFAEETWTDLAWLAQPVPPLSRILTIQAPYAGTVFDETVKGTFVDAALQPFARYADSFRALNGLAGPPVYVAMICALGRREQVTDPRTGQPAVWPDGSPVMDYDARTKMMFAGLRYSLLQMTKIGDVRAEEISERTSTMAERMRAVDVMIENLFAVPQLPPQSAPAGHPEAGWADSGTVRPDPDPAWTDGGAWVQDGGYPYPDPSVTRMDGTGADPGRMGL